MKKGPTRDELNRFNEDIAIALQSKQEPSDVPEIEVPRQLIEFFNPGNRLAGFEAVGYFIYEGVKVFEEGKKEQAVSKENIPMEQRVHGTVQPS